MNKITDYRIVISSTPTLNERRAADFVRKAVRLVCGKTLSVVSDSETPTALEIVIGKTARETLDGIAPVRAHEKEYEYVIKTVGSRLYIMGLGHSDYDETPFKPYASFDDGQIGTLHAAYRFANEILGYDVVYYVERGYTENESLTMPENYECVYTRESLEDEQPKLLSGAVLYSVGGVSDLGQNTTGFIFKTENGKLIVLDGGNEGELELILSLLRDISGKEIPTVELWLVSGVRANTVGAFKKLCRMGGVRVNKVCCSFADSDFYTAKDRKRAGLYAEAIETIENGAKMLGAEIITAECGKDIIIDEFTVETLMTNSMPDRASMSLYDAGTVFRVKYRDNSLLFPGDIGPVGAKTLMEKYGDALKSDAVQVANHGVSPCPSIDFYSCVKPKKYLWQVSNASWYGDNGEGLNAYGGRVLRIRKDLFEAEGGDEKFIILNRGVHSFELPIK